VRRPLALLAIASVLAVSGCGADDATVGSGETVTSAAARLSRQAPAPVASGALSGIADGVETRRRVGYVQPQALAALLPASTARAATERILGADGARVLGAGDGVRTAVQAGRVTVLQSDDGRREVRGTGPTARALADAAPERSVIQPTSPSAVQSCLGDAAAQTLVGSGVLGRNSTMGVGLRSGQDAPAGLKLVVCVSPNYRKQLYGSIRAMERRFGRPDERDPRSPQIGEDEIGEQQIAFGVIPVELLSRTELLDLLEGGDALRSLLPDPPV
jgi:hypothetical protein